MGANKRYSGYRSFQYLEPHVDYALYPLEKEVDRVPQYDFGLTKTQEERVREIVEKNVMISLHDQLEVYAEKGYQDPTLRSGRRFTAYEGIAHTGFDCVFDQVIPDLTPWDNVVERMGMVMSDYYHQDFIIPCLKGEDVEKAFREGKCAVLSVIEELSTVDRNLDRIDILYGLGIRSMGICHSESNALGGGLRELRDGGLTDLGYDAIVRMNKLGVLIEVAHAGDVTTMDEIEASKDPVVMSHRGSRTLTNTRRMAPDEVLQACAEKNGVVGIIVAGLGLRTKRHPEPSIEGSLEHMEYCIDLLGIDHVGIGPDTFYADHIGLYKARERRLTTFGYGHHARPRTEEQTKLAEQRRSWIRETDYVKGFENPSDFTNVIRGLVRDGYSDAEIAKVAGGNGLRLLKQVL